MSSLFHMSRLRRTFLVLSGLCFCVAAVWYVTEPNYSELLYVGEDVTQHQGARVAGNNGPPTRQKDSCKFPTFDPFNEYAMKYYKNYPTVTCDGMPTITHYNGQTVKVNKMLKQKAFGNKNIDCWYRSVTYSQRFYYKNGDWRGPFRDVIEVPQSPQSVEVKCEDDQSKEVSRMHHYVVREEERRKLKPPSHKQFKENHMNILLLCIDSMSAALFERAMPKTRDYLLTKLNVVPLKKYNKIGSNTFPNLMAILGGVNNNDLKGWSEALDYSRIPFVWNQFKAAGYRTQYATDRADFDNFAKVPIDSFSGPMSRALMKNKVSFDNNCFEDKVEVKLWLDHALEFARESLFTTGRYFSFTMLNRPTHDFPNQASAVDEHWFNFFKELNDTGLLNNTFMAFFGDHGPRLGHYRNSIYGSIEERAANMLVYTPSSFKVKYPTHYKNLVENSKRLTTNYDIHETLQNILSLPSFSSQSSAHNNIRSNTGMKRGLSLFSAIPPSRTCEDANIPAHYCLCSGGVSVNEPVIEKEAGIQVVNEINALLQSRSDVCEKLTLKSVNSLALLNGKVGRSSRYRVTLTTLPGNAMFEATVDYSVTLFFFKSIKTLEGISRINLYRGQSDCVDDKLLKQYCYCKSLQGNTS